MCLASGDDAAAQWTVFLLVSYVLGHFVFMAGSYLDPVYDQWRQRAKPTERDRTFRAADAVYEKLTPDLKRGKFTTLKWAKSYIQIHEPGARVEIDRIEANSKFFRGVVVVSAALFVHFVLGEPSFLLAMAAVALGALSFWRYCDQRWKATELSYATAVILHETQGRKATRTGDAEGGEGD